MRQKQFQKSNNTQSRPLNDLGIVLSFLLRSPNQNSCSSNTISNMTFKDQEKICSEVWIPSNLSVILMQFWVHQILQKMCTKSLRLCTMRLAIFRREKTYVTDVLLGRPGRSGKTIQQAKQLFGMILLPTFLALYNRPPILPKMLYRIPHKCLIFFSRTLKWFKQ